MISKKKLGTLCFIITMTLMSAVGCSANKEDKGISSSKSQEEKQKNSNEKNNKENKENKQENKNENNQNNKKEGEQNKFFWEENMPKDTAALIINKLNDNQYESFKDIAKVSLDDSKEKIFLVCAADGVDIQVWTVEYVEDKLVEKQLKFEKKNAKKNSALELQCYRPEGIPNYKIKISSSSGSLEYPISFRDGKDGPKDIEYLTYGMK
ncbi:hypothetical protein [Hathewaya massiliensis]|uniref:hypothetical protein n=1 Tax=Hathewaya massiliensis TaxID=1964382 RepID=UPI001158B4E3|nr:hypothetical protein [Hathewaya massiliensis]